MIRIISTTIASGLCALISRDVRLVAIAVIAACAGTGTPWSSVFIWLKLHH